MKDKYYAIKVGNDVEDIIVSSWEECKEYVIGYPAIYKKFTKKKEAIRYLKSITAEEIECILIKKERYRIKQLQSKLEGKYKFKIPLYIADEIVINNDYNNLCLLLNIALINHRLTKKQCEIIKQDYLYNNLK